MFVDCSISAFAAKRLSLRTSRSKLDTNAVENTSVTREKEGWRRIVVSLPSQGEDHIGPGNGAALQYE
jgi:hypothetical protein